MNEQEALSRMISPGMRREGKPNGGVIQILVTSSCDMACTNCTQASNLRRKPWFMSREHFEQACKSLVGYWGTIGVFGGNPAIHLQFEELCHILRSYFPKSKCGIWSNNPLGHGAEMRKTFSEQWSNLNVHLSKSAYDEFKRDWPESRPFGLEQDSRHAPVFTAMKDVLKKPCPGCNFADNPHGVGNNPSGRGGCERCQCEGYIYDESRAWELISRCPINQHWSAGIGVFRNQLRAWFCEIAMAQSILYQDDASYPDTGIDLATAKYVGMGDWWRWPMEAFAGQVRKHCHDCGVPLNGYGALAQASDADAVEQVSETHAAVYHPKRKGRRVEVVTRIEQLGMGRIQKATAYLENAKR